MGEVVRVKDGFARNFLLKRGKALRATTDNRAKFEGMKARPRSPQPAGQGRGDQGRRKIDGRNVVILRQASGIRAAVRIGVDPRYYRIVRAR